MLHLRAIFRQFLDRATQFSSATDEVAKSLVVSQQRRLRAAVSFYAGGVTNLFDQEFFFQDDNFRSSNYRAPAYIPARSAFVKLSLVF